MRRLKKILKYLALTVGVLVAVGLVANAIFVWRSGKSLEDRLSALRAAGEPLSLPELGAMPVAPGADAATVLKRIEPEVKALSKEITPLLDEQKHPRPWPDKHWNAIETAYANHPTVLPALAEAAACPSYKSPLNYRVTPTPEFIKSEMEFVTQFQRELANILAYHARFQLRGQDRDGAMRSCLTALRISRHAQNEPMLISFLVACATRHIAIVRANEVLRAGPVAADLHRELEAELAKHDNSDAYRWGLRSERAFGLQTIEEMNFVGWLTRAYNNDNKSHYLNLFDEWIGQADSSFQNYDRSAKWGGSKLWQVLSRLLIPAIDKAREVDFRARCMVRCLRVLNALTEKKTTEAPAKLTDLGLPAAAVTDPYTDKPLIVKRVDGQWVVYGLGPNLKDDGGQFEKWEDVGVGPVKPEK